MEREPAGAVRLGLRLRRPAREVHRDHAVAGPLDLDVDRHRELRVVEAPRKALRQGRAVAVPHELHDRLVDRVVADEQVAAGRVAFHDPPLRIQHRHADGHGLELVAESGELGGQRLLAPVARDALAGPDDLAGIAGNRAEHEAERVPPLARKLDDLAARHPFEGVVAELLEGAGRVVLAAEDIHDPEAFLLPRLGAAQAQELEEGTVDVGEPPFGLFDGEAGPRDRADPLDHGLHHAAPAPQGAPDEDQGDAAQDSHGGVDRDARLGRKADRLFEVVQDPEGDADEQHQQEEPAPAADDDGGHFVARLRRRHPGLRRLRPAGAPSGPGRGPALIIGQHRSPSASCGL